MPQPIDYPYTDMDEHDHGHIDATVDWLAGLEESVLVEVEGEGKPVQLKGAVGWGWTILENTIRIGIPLVMITLYTLLGGYVFKECEKFDVPAENRMLLANHSEKLGTWVSTFGRSCGASDNALQADLKDFLDDFDVQNPENKLRNWDGFGASFFAATLYTTLGYGSYAPQTFGGQLATIIYSLIGIPIFVILMATWGKLLFRVFKWCWLWFIKVSAKFCLCYRNYLRRHGRSMAKIDEGSLPTPVILTMLLGWVVITAGIFMLLETKWEFFKSFYFSFISTTTIGLGDVTTSTLRIGVLTFPLIWAGLAVVSMLLSVLQHNLEVFVDQMLGKVQSVYLEMVATDDSASLNMDQLKKRLPCWQRLLLAVLGDSGLRQIEKSIEQYSNQRSVQTQTLSAETEREEMETQTISDISSEASSSTASGEKVFNWSDDDSVIEQTSAPVTPVPGSNRKLLVLFAGRNSAPETPNFDQRPLPAKREFPVTQSSPADEADWEPAAVVHPTLIQAPPPAQAPTTAPSVTPDTVRGAAKPPPVPRIMVEAPEHRKAKPETGQDVMQRSIDTIEGIKFADDED